MIRINKNDIVLHFYLLRRNTRAIYARRHTCVKHILESICPLALFEKDRTTLAWLRIREIRLTCNCMLANLHDKEITAFQLGQISHLLDTVLLGMNCTPLSISTSAPRRRSIIIGCHCNNLSPENKHRVMKSLGPMPLAHACNVRIIHK